MLLILEIDFSGYSFYAFQGFEHLDPFIPVEVTNYSHKEVHSQINYYIDRRWLIQPLAHTEAGRNEILHASGANPYSLMQIVAPY